MNWRRGLTRMYLVVWFLWACLIFYGVILSHLNHGRRTELYVTRISVEKYNREILGADTVVTDFWGKSSTGDSMETYRSREVGKPRWHFDPPLTFGGVLGVLAVALLVPAAILGALRWIVAGFRGRGASDG